MEQFCQHLQYAVVVFQTSDGEEVNAVPLSWLTLNLTRCAWPPKSTPTHKIIKAIKSLQIPRTDWLQFTVKCLGIYGDYETASKKSKKAEITSELDTAMSNTEKGSSAKRRKKNVDDFPNDDYGYIDGEYECMNNASPNINVDKFLSKKNPKANKDYSDNDDDFQIFNKSLAKKKSGVKKLLLPPQPPQISDKSISNRICDDKTPMLCKVMTTDQSDLYENQEETQDSSSRMMQTLPEISLRYATPLKTTTNYLPRT